MDHESEDERQFNKLVSSKFIFSSNKIISKQKSSDCPVEGEFHKEIYILGQPLKEVENTLSLPYCSVGLIVILIDGFYSFGTGCLVGPNVILTCAHNLYFHEKQK